MTEKMAQMMEYEKLSRAGAIEKIEYSDKKRTDFIKSLYNHDLRKAHHYDLVIRTGPNLTIENAACLIVKLAKKRFHL